MKRGSTTFLKGVIILIGLAVLSGLVWFPPHEGAAAGQDLLSIYTNPFIIYIYLASIPFFTAIFQGIKLLGLIEKNKIFTQAAVHAVKNVKYCAFLIVGLLVATMGWIRLMAGDDDPAGAIAIGIVLTFASIIVGTTSAVLQKTLQSAVDLKSENDLTV